jgi:hypothetical protein
VTENALLLLERENKMQQTAIDIFAACQKTGVSVQDLMIVFGGILRKQASEAEKEPGVQGGDIQKELLSFFALGVSGVMEITGLAH